MNPSDIAFIKGVVAFLALAATGFAGVGLWLRARPRQHPQLDGIIKELREEDARNQEALETRIAELEERLHFTERLLDKQAAPAQLAREAEHPRTQAP